MLPKVLLLVCLIPLALGSKEEMMEMMKMFGEKMGGGSGEDKGMGGGSGEDKGMGGGSGEDKGMGGGSGEDKGMGEEHGMGGTDHFKGDGDCKSEEEAMKKKFMMFKKMMEMKKHHEMEEKKKEMAEKIKKFKMFMAFAHKMKEEKEKAMEQHKMFEMLHKFKMMHQKEDKEGEFKDMIEGFQEKKHKFAFSIAHHFLALCKCGEVDYQMNQMFTGNMGNNVTNGTDLMENMAEEGALDNMMSGDVAKLTEKVKKMSHEQKKKLYMTGLIKSMCHGAKAFVNHAKKFEEKFMKGDESKTKPSKE